jgi:hypothetical protein
MEAVRPMRSGTEARLRGTPPNPPVELERLDADASGCPRRQLDHVLIVELTADPTGKKTGIARVAEDHRLVS